MGRCWPAFTRTGLVRCGAARKAGNIIAARQLDGIARRIVCSSILYDSNVSRAVKMDVAGRGKAGTTVERGTGKGRRLRA